MANMQPMRKCEVAGCSKNATHEVIAKDGKSIGKFCYPDAQRKWMAQEKKERGVRRGQPYDGDLPPDTRRV